MIPVAPGLVAGALAAAGAVSTAAGYPALAAILTDPSTAQAATLACTAVLAVVAGVAQGVKAYKADRAAKAASGR